MLYDILCANSRSGSWCSTVADDAEAAKAAVQEYNNSHELTSLTVITVQLHADGDPTYPLIEDNEIVAGGSI